MIPIQELIGDEAARRLRKRYGPLVDIIGVGEKVGECVLSRIFRMELLIQTRKMVSKKAAKREIEDAIGVGVAEMEYALYHTLGFKSKGKTGVRLNNNLPRNGLDMHPVVYAKLMRCEREAMLRIEERLNG